MVMSGVAALAALALNGVLAMLLFAQRRVRSRAEALAAERAVALQRSEGAFLAVAESARVAIVTTDAQGRLTYANAAAEQMLGASREQLRGVSSMQYVADVDRDDLPTVSASSWPVRAVSPPARRSIMGRRQSGEVFPFELSLSWYDAPEGRYITGVLVDLTERLRTEAAVRDAEERWKVALESTDDGVWDWDVATGTWYGSRRLFELVGHDAPAGAIDIDRWNALVHPDDLPAVLRDLDAHLAGGHDRYFPSTASGRVMATGAGCSRAAGSSPATRKAGRRESSGPAPTSPSGAGRRRHCGSLASRRNRRHAARATSWR